MPKKSLYITVGIILLLLIGGGSYLLMSKKTSPNTPRTESSMQSTLKGLLAKGIAQKCTFTDKTESFDMSGVMYMAGNRLRGDYNSVMDGKTIVSHMITDNNTSYTWQDDQTTGFMMKFEPEKVTAGAANQDKNITGESKSTQNQTFDPEKVVDYKCSPWITDNSLFVPPKNIKFTDYSSMVVPSVPQTNSGKDSQNFCSTCDNLEGEAKSQCRTALKCK